MNDNEERYDWRKELEELKMLQPNWDGYNAHVPSARSITRASRDRMGEWLILR